MDAMQRFAAALGCDESEVGGAGGGGGGAGAGLPLSTQAHTAALLPFLPALDGTGVGADLDLVYSTDLHEASLAALHRACSSAAPAPLLLALQIDAGGGGAAGAGEAPGPAVSSSVKRPVICVILPAGLRAASAAGGPPLSPSPPCALQLLPDFSLFLPPAGGDRSAAEVAAYGHRSVWSSESFVEVVSVGGLGGNLREIRLGGSGGGSGNTPLTLSPREEGGGGGGLRASLSRDFLADLSVPVADGPDGGPVAVEIVALEVYAVVARV
jgi:hypothetical protein